MKLSIGQVVQGRFEVERILGAGGTALVYLVKERATEQRYALKLLTITSAAIRERMLREGKVQGEIAHPNVIRVTEVLDIEGAPALIMEYVDGPSLEQALGRYRLTMGDAETLFQGVLAGVAAAHAAGLVHRDLKPANILLARTRDGFVPKVTDFGLAKLTDGESLKQVGQTRSGIAMGTPSYMSPEQIRDAKTVDKRADLWSLGCILYELVSRQRAFPGDEALAIYNAIVEGEFIPVRKHVRDIPARLEQAIHGCLRNELDDRIPDCDELLAVLLGVREWPLPENTLTELARETPATPREADRTDRRVEYHPGGAPESSTGATAASAPTALAPMTGPLPSSSRSGPAFSSDGAFAAGAALGSEPIPGPHHEEEEAATVITQSPLLEGTLAPHVSPHAPPPAEGRGWLLGGGLVAVGLLGALGASALGLMALIGWLLLPDGTQGRPPAPDPVAPIAAPAPTAPAPSVPALAEPTAPTPVDTEPRPAEPRPAEPKPAEPKPTEPKPPPPAPANPKPAEPKPPGPVRDPRPPVSADPTRQVPDLGVADKVEVRIGTLPYGATVHVGNHQGSGPFKVGLTPSRHPVIVSAPGYEAFSQLVAVSVEGSNTWCFDLIQRQVTTEPCP